MTQKITDHSSVNEHTVRLQKLENIRKGDALAYPNDFTKKHHTSDLISGFDDASQESGSAFQIAGRIMTRRLMGKAAFFHLQDQTGQIQVYLQKQEIGEDAFEFFKTCDLGDVVGITGSLFRTRVGEVTLRAASIRLLAKCLHAMPEKFHGLQDQEQRYRQRYLDILVNPTSRNVLKNRSKIVRFIREYVENLDFMEVETPMMHAIPGGANAKPFETWHHALDRSLFLRIAPELYLKRLIVAGFERVFEINRNFRNEGLSTRHNPEFTTIEFYQAYSTYKDLMVLIEDLLQKLVVLMFEDTQLDFQGKSYDFSSPFKRIKFLDAVFQKFPVLKNIQDQPNALKTFFSEHKLDGSNCKEGIDYLCVVFDKLIEPELKDPVFVTHYPAVISPLARACDDNAVLTDRFELFIAGREIANGFSELNDPKEQAKRFEHQLQKRNSGDEESMHFDRDYIKALEYGMPPTAGAGIGIDRLVMILTNSPTIKDVILFPHLKNTTS